jgi:hypothetical protein
VKAQAFSPRSQVLNQPLCAARGLHWQMRGFRARHAWLRTIMLVY